MVFDSCILHTRGVHTNFMVTSIYYRFKLIFKNGNLFLKTTYLFSTKVVNSVGQVNIHLRFGCLTSYILEYK
ncbi:hypothetical protein Avbf_03366 [Armadillidium vulgare]|nr:hypothetical protein Avbf_03366 [Armadillidium vulgare]